MKSIRWFAVDIDRDYTDSSYGDGIRIYIDSPEEPTDNVGNLKYCVVTGISFDESLKILRLQDESGQFFNLENEPDNNYFKNTLYHDWKIWDNKCGSGMEEDRCDYKPWALNSLESLAVELKVHSNSIIEKFYNPE